MTASVWTVLALAGDRVTVRGAGLGTDAVGPDRFAVVGAGQPTDRSAVAGPVGAVGPLLANLTDVELTAVCERAAHVREVLTGYRSGSPEDALAGEPRADYQPGTRLMDRYRAKAGSWVSG